MSETVEELQAQVRLLQEQEAQLAQRDAATQAQIAELQGPSPAQEQAALVEDVSGSASTTEVVQDPAVTAAYQREIDGIFEDAAKQVKAYREPLPASPYREHGRLGEEGGV